MTLIIWLIFAYEIFGNLLTEFARQALSSPTYNTSALERKLWKEKSTLSFFSMVFLFVSRINGIIFLIYLGYKSIWWHPIVLWVGCLIATGVVASMLKGRTGIVIPALLGFIVIPVTGITLWLII